MPTDMEVIEDLNADEPTPIEPKRLLRKSRAINHVLARVETRITRLNDVFIPGGPPIEPELKDEILAELTSAQAHCDAVTAGIRALLAKLG